MRALIVDDSALMLKNHVRLLASLGFEEILTAAEVESAWDALNDSDYRVDLLLVDFCLPGENGLELVRRVRATAGMEEVPVLVVTSARNPELGVRAVLTGADGVLRKPLLREPLETLLRDLRALLDVQL